MMKVLLTATTLAAATIGVAAAQDPASKAIDPVATRQAGYDLMGSVMGQIKEGLKAGENPSVFKDAAKAIARWSTVVPTLFPPGSDKSEDTKALPVIWSDRATFDKDAAALHQAADRMAQAAAANDKAAFAAEFKATADACGACHRKFRAR
jgi:cytochrome c556